MILEELTNAAFSYYSWELTSQSHKPILAACDDCGKVRETSKYAYCALCRSCAMVGKNIGENSPNFGIARTEETKALISAALKGKKQPHKGVPHTEETKALMSAAKKGKKNSNFGKTASAETKALMSAAQTGNQYSLGHKHTEATKALMSKNHADQRGEKSPNWLGGISFEPYCIKFNNDYKEHIRNLFGNECFLCGMSEEDNGQALSVHHKDYNKDCGCDGTVCKCVPLCRSCHSKTGADRDFWECLITEMLQPVEAWI